MRRLRNQANALKHGVFTKQMILPSEDRREFENLYRSLADEWKPVGPTENDAVLSIAKAMWRKRRIQYFMRTERSRATIDPNHTIYDEAGALRLFSSYIESEPDDFDRAVTTLPASVAQHLRRRLPREDFQSVSDWVHAIQKEIASVLLPAAAERIVKGEALIHREAGFFTLDVIKDEVAVEDRIDAMIDRAVKRLVQTKTMKQMLSAAFADRGSDQPKSLLSNKPQESAKILVKKQNGRRSQGTREAAAMRTRETPRNSKPDETT